MPSRPPSRVSRGGLRLRCVRVSKNSQSALVQLDERRGLPPRTRLRDPPRRSGFSRRARPTWSLGPRDLLTRVRGRDRMAPRAHRGGIRGEVSRLRSTCSLGARALSESRRLLSRSRTRADSRGGEQALPRAAHVRGRGATRRASAVGHGVAGWCARFEPRRLARSVEGHERGRGARGAGAVPESRWRRDEQR
jgi:hypothetical protein